MQSSSIKTIGFLEKEGKVGLGSASRPEKLGPRDVLIKVHYAPISKYDKACMNVEKKEKICGAEGAGIIEDVGQGLQDKNLKGRKVAFCHQAWQEYVVKDVDCLLFFDDKVDLRMAANAVTNPLAALCLKYMLLDRNIKSFVVFGASSTLGTMLMRIALRKNLSPIAVVQDEEEIKRLRACLGDKVPMAKVDEAFELIEKEKPLVLIDLAGSERSGSLFERMPANSEMIVVGNLSNERLKLSTTEFFMHNKRLRGFNFERFLSEEVSEERRRELLKIIEDDINSGGEYFGLKEFKEFRLEDWNKALQEKGRVLIDFTEAPK